MTELISWWLNLINKFTIRELSERLVIFSIFHQKQWGLCFYTRPNNFSFIRVGASALLFFDWTYFTLLQRRGIAPVRFQSFALIISFDNSRLSGFFRQAGAK